jgi:hypothetical protein
MNRNTIVAFFLGVAVTAAALALRTASPVYAQGPAGGYSISATNNGAYIVSSDGTLVYCTPSSCATVRGKQR